MRKLIVVCILIAATIILSVDLFHKLNEVGHKMSPNAGLIPAVQVVKLNDTGKSTLQLVMECDQMKGELIYIPTSAGGYFQCEVDL